MAGHSPWTGLDSGSSVPLSASQGRGPLSAMLSPHSSPRIPLPCVVALPGFIVLGQVLISACSLWSNITRDRIAEKILSNTTGARGFSTNRHWRASISRAIKTEDFRAQWVTSKLPLKMSFSAYIFHFASIQLWRTVTVISYKREREGMPPYPWTLILGFHFH